MVRIPAAAQAQAHPGHSHVPPRLFLSTITKVFITELV